MSFLYFINYVKLSRLKNKHKSSVFDCTYVRFVLNFYRNTSPIRILIKCAVDPSSFIGRFYGTFNNILNVMRYCRNEMSALQLVQTYCLPSLLYSCETWSLSSCDEKRVDVAWNNAFRKIFSAYWHESVKPLQYYCSCLPVSILLPTKKLLFWKKMLCSGNLILCRLAKCCYARIFALAAKYDIELHDVVRSSVARIMVLVLN